ncbi:hypothetical protein EHM69_03880 [candidate division KSB1 bacterium]|nr:MAG: hypothetical protein EHM69_03880 [candidate division KSB1 bacterium]
MLLRRIICVLFLTALPLFGSLVVYAGSEYRHHALVKVDVASDVRLKELLSLQLDVVPGPTKYEPMIVARPEDLDLLNRAGFRHEVIHEDLERFYADRARDEGHLDDMGGYKTWAEIIAVLDSMHSRFPAITTARFSVGTSIESRDLWCLKISDNPDVDEDEPELFYNALIHAREPAGMEVVIYFMNYLLDNYGTNPQVTEIVNNRELFFVPCVNPDGYEYNRQTNPNGGGMYRKNRRLNYDGSYGIDLNRNWGYTWGLDDEGSSGDPSDITYRGAAAFSEPETAGLRDFINARHFVGSIDYHTYSNLVLIPWGTNYFHGTGITEDDVEFRLIVDSMATAIQSVNGVSYEVGTAWELLYNTNGGSFDWEYGDTTQHQKMYSVSTEVGNQTDNFWPAPSRIIPLAAENLQANLFFARYVGTLGQAPPVTVVTPMDLDIAVGTTETTTREIYVSNNGGRDMAWTAVFANGAATRDTGGPDAFGYHWQDSEEACGPAYQWLPISTLGTPLTFGTTEGDAVRGPYALGFDFPFYGHLYSRLWISANGWISFIDSTYTSSSNRALPSVSGPAAAICGWWDDLKPQLAGTNIRFWTNGVDSAAAHYENVRAGTSPQGTYNFQILITSNGDIRIFYGNMGTLRLNSATIAIQNDTRSMGLTILSNQTGVGNNIARRFATGPRWISVSPSSGMLPPGQTDTLRLLVDGSLLCGEISHSALEIHSNDVITPVVSVPIMATSAIPESPMGLTAYWTSEGIELRWNPSGFALAYVIERADSVTGEFDSIGTSDTTIYVDTEAVAEPGPFFYQVKAVSGFAFPPDLPISVDRRDQR